MRIQPVVEGHGEVRAVPALLRRLQEASGAYGLAFNRPIRRGRPDLVDEARLRTTIRLALLQEECRGILILLDGDDDCPRDLAPRLQAWACAEAGEVPCAVVIAQREYEAWFLGAMESLRGQRGIRSDAVSHPSPEAIRGASEWLAQNMSFRPYGKTIDQVALTAVFDLGAAYSHCRSFRRMVRAFGILAAGAGIALEDWPPAAWSTP